TPLLALSGLQTRWAHRHNAYVPLRPSDRTRRSLAFNFIPCVSSLLYEFGFLCNEARCIGRLYERSESGVVIPSSGSAVAAHRAADGTTPGAASWKRKRNQRAYPGLSAASAGDAETGPGRLRDTCEQGWHGYRGENPEVFRRSHVRRRNSEYASPMAVAPWS